VVSERGVVKKKSLVGGNPAGHVRGGAKSKIPPEKKGSPKKMAKRGGDNNN